MPTRNSKLFVANAKATGGVKANSGKTTLRVHQEYIRPEKSNIFFALYISLAWILDVPPAAPQIIKTYRLNLNGQRRAIPHFNP